MNRLSRALRWAWATAAQRYDSPAMEPGTWGPEDRNRLAAFMRSETGERLAVILRRQVSWEASQAVRAPIAELPRRAGWALGCRAMAGLFDVLSGADPQTGNTDAAPIGGTTTAPQSQQGAELRERLQP